MTRKEAVLAMLDGKKIKVYESSDNYMYFGTHIGFRYVYGCGDECSVSGALSLEDGYLLAEEPQTCDGKVVEIDGKKYELKEV